MYEAAKRVGLKINQTKSKVITINTRYQAKLTVRKLKSSMHSHNYLGAKIGKERMRKGRSTEQAIKAKALENLELK